VYQVGTNKGKGLSSLYIDVWVFNCEFLQNPSQHMLQTNGFLSEYVNIRVFKLPSVLKPVTQTLHLCGFSPVWVKLWVLGIRE